MQITLELNSLSQNLTVLPAPSGREPLAWRHSFRLKCKACGRACSPGGAVAQRLRGCKSAEPEKTVKRSSRRTGVNLQFFPVEPTSLGLSRACSPWPVAGWVESRGREGGIGTPLPASGPAERPCTLAASRNFPRSAQYAFPVLFWCQKRTFPPLIFPHRTARTPVQ